MFYICISSIKLDLLEATCSRLTCSIITMTIFIFVISPLFAAQAAWRIRKDLATPTSGQCYKTFYHGNLLPFHGNTIILCYKATLPW